MKEVKTRKIRTFGLGTQEKINVPIRVIIGVQQRDRQGSQKLNKCTFYRAPATSAQCIRGTEKYPEAAILIDYDDEVFSQGYGQIKEALKALTKYDIRKLYISDQRSRSTNVNVDGEAINDFGFIFFVFDMRYQKNLEAAQPYKVEFKFSKDVPVGIYGYALVLTNKLVSISSDGQKPFDSI